MLTENKLPTCMLKNTKTGRFHPIVFQRSPMPGLADEGSNHHRYRSFTHHTSGFDTFEAAKEHIQNSSRMVWMDRTWEWDGVNIPTMTQFFESPER